MVTCLYPWKISFLLKAGAYTIEKVASYWMLVLIPLKKLFAVSLPLKKKLLVKNGCLYFRKRNFLLEAGAYTFEKRSFLLKADVYIIEKAFCWK